MGRSLTGRRQRPPERRSAHGHDIAIYGDDRRKDEHAESQDLTVMATVLDEVIDVLARTRQPVR